MDFNRDWDCENRSVTINGKTARITQVEPYGGEGYIRIYAQLDDIFVVPGPLTFTDYDTLDIPEGEVGKKITGKNFAFAVLGGT